MSPAKRRPKFNPSTRKRKNKIKKAPFPPDELTEVRLKIKGKDIMVGTILCRDAHKLVSRIREILREQAS